MSQTHRQEKKERWITDIVGLTCPPQPCHQQKICIGNLSILLPPRVFSGIPPSPGFALISASKEEGTKLNTSHLHRPLIGTVRRAKRSSDSTNFHTWLSQVDLIFRWGGRVQALLCWGAAKTLKPRCRKAQRRLRNPANLQAPAKAGQAGCCPVGRRFRKNARVLPLILNSVIC